MTSADPFLSRPVPDVADLRLLAEIINNGAIGLPQAAWNAGMSQAEAAARLVTMAERGMPLRLVAEGDRQQLWHIAQAGPAVPVPPAVGPPAFAPSAPTPAFAAPAGPPSPMGHPAPTTGPLGASVAHPTTGPQATAAPDPTPEDSGPAAVWGVPGTADWVRPTDQPAHGSDPTDDDPAGTPADAEPEPADSTSGSSNAEPPAPSTTPDTAAPTRRVLTSGQPLQAVVGLFGEQLDVRLQQILDPADDILTAVGYRLEEGERALLVQTSIGNRGSVPYESLADLYLQVVDAGGAVLRKAAMAVAGYPAHTVGVPAHTLASGWTVFLVPAGTEVAQVRWSVRPDLADRTVTWSYGPAPTHSAAD